MQGLTITLAIVCLIGLLMSQRVSFADEPVRVYLVPTTHMDIDYTAPPEESMRHYAEFVSKAVAACDEDPMLRYSVQLTSAAELFWRTYPDQREAFARMVRAGRIELVSNWTNPHYSELPEELFIRQIAGSAFWIHEHTGVWPTVADNGELADVTPQLAAVLAGTGIHRFHSYKTVRLAPPARGPGYTGTMWFVGLDGSRILYNADNYNQSVEFVEGFKDRPWDWPAGRASGERGLDRCPTGSARLFTDGGPGWDDCLPEFAKLGRFLRGWNADPECSAKGTYALATYAEFFADIERQTENGLSLPVRTGHTEHGELLYRWAWNRYRDLTLFHEAMVQAETLGVWCDWLTLGGLAPDDTDTAWRLAMDCCTHNWGNKDRQTGQLLAKAVQAREQAEKLRDDMLAKLGDGLGAKVGETKEPRLLAVNTLPHARRELVAVGDGRRVLDLPAMGYVVTATRAEAGPANDLTAGEGVIENAFYRVRANAKDGLVEVHDKRRGRPLLRAVDGKSVLTLGATYNEAIGTRGEYVRTGTEHSAAAKLMVEYLNSLEQAFKPSAVRTRLAGEAAVMTVSGQIGDAKVEITVRLGAGLDWVELEFSGGEINPPASIVADNRLKDLLGRGPMVFAAVEFDLPDEAFARTSVPFGSVRLPGELPTVGPATAERFSRATAAAGAEGWNGVYDESWHVPLRELAAARAVQPRWTSLWTEQGGVTWLQRSPFANLLRDKDHPTRFYKSLWQGSSAGGQYVWRLYGHEGDWRTAQAPRRAEELNAPVLTLENVAVPEQRRSFLAVEQPNMIFCALRRSFDGKTTILRLHEAHDADTSLELSGGVAGEAALVDLVERPIADADSPGGPIPVGAFQIVTLQLGQ